MAKLKPILEALERDCETVGVKVNRSKLIQMYNEWKRSEYESFMEYLSFYIFN